MSLPKQQLRDVRRHSDPYPRRPRELSTTRSAPHSSRTYSSLSTHRTHLKIETEALTTFPPSPAPSSSTPDYPSSAYHSPVDASASSIGLALEYHLDIQSNPKSSYGLPEIQISHTTEENHNVPAVHAPQPRKLSVSAPTISTLEVRAADSNEPSAHFLESDGSTVITSNSTVDPRMLTGEQFVSHPQEYMAAPYTVFPTSTPL